MQRSEGGTGKVFPGGHGATSLGLRNRSRGAWKGKTRDSPFILSLEGSLWSVPGKGGGMMEVVSEGTVPPVLSQSLKNKVTREGRREQEPERKEGFP